MQSTGYSFQPLSLEGYIGVIHGEVAKLDDHLHVRREVLPLLLLLLLGAGAGAHPLPPHPLAVLDVNHHNVIVVPIPGVKVEVLKPE